MVKSNLKYRVTLTGEERVMLEKLVRQGRTAGYRIRHAHILLTLDEIPENAHWTDAAIAAAYQTSMRSVGSIRKRFVEEGFSAALERKKRELPPHIKIDGEKEARIIAEACTTPPEGYARWTLSLLAGRMVELGVFDSISATAIGTTLKKTKSNPGGIICGVYLPHRHRLSPRWKTFWRYISGPIPKNSRWCALTKQTGSLSEKPKHRCLHSRGKLPCMTMSMSAMG